MDYTNRRFQRADKEMARSWRQTVSSSVGGNKCMTGRKNVRSYEENLAFMNFSSFFTLSATNVEIQKICVGSLGVCITTEIRHHGSYHNHCKEFQISNFFKWTISL